MAQSSTRRTVHTARTMMPSRPLRRLGRPLSPRSCLPRLLRAPAHSPCRCPSASASTVPYAGVWLHPAGDRRGSVPREPALPAPPVSALRMAGHADDHGHANAGLRAGHQPCRCQSFRPDRWMRAEPAARRRPRFTSADGGRASGSLRASSAVRLQPGPHPDRDALRCDFPGGRREAFAARLRIDGAGPCDQLGDTTAATVNRGDYPAIHGASRARPPCMRPTCVALLHTAPSVPDKNSRSLPACRRAPHTCGWYTKP